MTFFGKRIAKASALVAVAFAACLTLLAIPSSAMEWQKSSVDNFDVEATSFGTPPVLTSEFFLSGQSVGSGTTSFRYGASTWLGKALYVDTAAPPLDYDIVQYRFPLPSFTFDTDGINGYVGSFSITMPLKITGFPNSYPAETITLSRDTFLDIASFTEDGEILYTLRVAPTTFDINRSTDERGYPTYNIEFYADLTEPVFGFGFYEGCTISGTFNGFIEVPLGRTETFRFFLLAPVLRGSIAEYFLGPDRTDPAVTYAPIPEYTIPSTEDIFHSLGEDNFLTILLNGTFTRWFAARPLQVVSNAYTSVYNIVFSNEDVRIGLYVALAGFVLSSILAGTAFFINRKK